MEGVGLSNCHLDQQTLNKTVNLISWHGPAASGGFALSGLRIQMKNKYNSHD